MWNLNVLYTSSIKGNGSQWSPLNSSSCPSKVQINVFICSESVCRLQISAPCCLAPLAMFTLFPLKQWNDHFKKIIQIGSNMISYIWFCRSHFHFTLSEEQTGCDVAWLHHLWRGQSFCYNELYLDAVGLQVCAWWIQQKMQSQVNLFVLSENLKSLSAFRPLIQMRKVNLWTCNRCLLCGSRSRCKQAQRLKVKDKSPQTLGDLKRQQLTLLKNV